MVVKTRTYYQKKQRETAAAEIEEADADTVYITSSARGGGGGGGRRNRRVQITTPSFLEANTRPYKIYAPVRKPTQMKDETSDYVEEADAAEVLMSFQEEEQHTDSPRSEDDEETLHVPVPTPAPPASTSAFVNHTCLNPMRVITKYMYRIGVYNITQTAHYKTAYVLYDNTSRIYYIYTIISNQIPNDAEADDEANAYTFVPSSLCSSLPEPRNTIQLRYTTYICDMAMNYIMTMVIPSMAYDYYIQDDIIGVVVQDDEFKKTAFGTDSSFYDIEGLLHDKSSSETTNGFKAFMLIPSRNYWYAPSGSSYFTTTELSSISNNRYTADIFDSAMMVLSQSK